MLDVVGDDVARRSESVRFRRALALIGMTLVLPGSAQLVAGNKAVGRAAVRIAASLALIAVGTVLVLGREAVLDLGLDPLALLAAQIVAVVLALCWLGLFLDAWRLGRPPALRRSQRLLSAGLSLSLMAGVAAPLFYGAHLLSVQRSLIGDLFADGDIGELYKGRLNVLLLGGDAGQDRVGVRTDTIVLASVDVANGRTVLFSLPRNLEGATFPPDTPAATEFPDGFPDFLYGVYTYGAEHPTMFAPAENPGAKAIQQAVAQTLGVPVHYYMLANLNGFRSLVNSLGGVTIRVQQRLPIGGGTKLDGTENPITGYIDPGLQKLNGYKALWYARSRASTSDYDRMNRQRCLLGGLLREADPVNVLRNYGDIAASTKSLLRTDMTRGALKALVDISDKVRAAGVDTLTFAPPRFDPADPDIKAVRARVQKAIKRSEDGGQDASTDAGGQGGGGKGGSNSGGGGQGGNSSGGGGGQGGAGQGRDGGGGQGGNSSGGGGGQGGAGQGGNGATDLSDVCRYA